MAIRVRYSAFDKAGQPVKGELEANSVQSAEEALWSSGLIVANVRRVRSTPSLATLFPSFFGPGTSTAISFSRQLATLLDSGFPLVKSLEVLSGDQTHPALRDATSKIRQTLSEGLSFSQALEQHPHIFPNIFVRLARIGEETGDLAPLLRRAANNLEAGVNLRSKIRSSLTYPAIVALTAGAAAYVLLTFSIPMLAGLLDEFDAELPLSTRIVVAIGNGFNVWVTRFFIFLAGSTVAFFLTRKTARGKLFIDRTLLLYPPFGGLLRRSALARIAQTWSSLIDSGISLMEATSLVIDSTDNAYIRRSMERIRERLLEGIAFSDALAEEPVFPPLMREMIRVGESSGTLTEQLNTVQNIYQAEFEGAVARIVGLMEPIMILGVGALVGLIGATIITTVYSVLPSAQGAL